MVVVLSEVIMSALEFEEKSAHVFVSVCTRSNVELIRKACMFSGVASATYQVALRGILEACT